jgi:hypothetical protein
MNYCGKNDFIAYFTEHSSFMGSFLSINLVIAVQTQLFAGFGECYFVQ